MPNTEEKTDEDSSSSNFQTLIKQKIRQRGTYKGTITRVKNFILAFDTENGDISLLQVKYDCLIDTWHKYDEIQTFLELHDENENIDREQVEDIVHSLSAKMQHLLHSNNQRSCNSSKKSCSSNYENHSTTVLPQINLPKFNGSYDNWLSFCEFFRVVVHNNPSLPAIQKFHYLLSSLTDSALQLIKNLPVTAENYLVAWNLLEARYSNKRLIASKHASEILEVQSVPKESAIGLANFIDKISSNINALKALNIDIPYSELILLQLFVHRLDQATVRAWEASIAANTFPTVDDFIRFLEKRRQMLESISVPSPSRLPLKPNLESTHFSKQASNFRREKDHKNRNHVFMHTVTPKYFCAYCKQSHYLYKCENFLKLPVHGRISFVKRHNLCFNCLNNNHLVKDCYNSHSCKYCKSKHHSCLHENRISASDIYNVSRKESCKNKNEPDHKAKVEEINSGVNIDANVSSNYCSFKIQSTPHILLATANVCIKDAQNQLQPCRVMLDAGSQANFITENMVQFLKLKRDRNDLPIYGINNASATARHSVKIQLHSNYENYSTTITCFVLPSITSLMPTSTIDTSYWKIPKYVTLADNKFNVPGKIDLLIGSELYLHLIKKGQIKEGEDLPVLQETKLGWIIAGRLPSSNEDQEPRNATSLLVSSNINIQNQLKKFWELEELNTTPRSKEETACENHFTENTKRDETGRFIVRLPRKQNELTLGNSLFNAQRRFQLLERKLSKNNVLRDDYVNFMGEYIQLNHMQTIKKPFQEECIVESNHNDEKPYYLPHHAVFKEASSTTKTRVVFDASAKTDNGISLNDTLMTGPVVQQNLTSIVLRFRTHAYAMTADIAKMYRQIRVDPRDYHLQRILWRNTPDEEIKHYELTTVTYGTASASFLATRCIIQLANENSEHFPRASEVISRDFYVDDLQTGCDDLEEAIQLKQEIISILKQGGFDLRKWCSNNPVLLGSTSEFNSVDHTFNFSNQGINTLGLIWDYNNDTLCFQINFSKFSNSFTKRTVLGIISSIFDPLGLLGPIVMSCKIFMQKLWLENLEWDDTLPENLICIWSDLFKKLPSIQQIRIPRFVKGFGKITNLQLHGFSDASKDGYGACIFLRSINSDGNITVNLLCSKSRVSPIKQISIPRLELCGALLLSRLFNVVIPALSLNIHKVYLWTDSTIVLSWLSAVPTKWKTFVANRVSEIQETTDNCIWGHVSSEDNPADIVSRGSNATELKSNQLWWHGPSWLKNQEESWQSNLNLNFDLQSFDYAAELRNESVSLVTICEISDLSLRFSSLHRMIRVISYCLRFIHKSRKDSSQTTITRELSVKEKQFALMRCIIQTQNIYFKPEIKDLKLNSAVSKNSKLSPLYPFIDENRCLRVGGRLQLSALNFDSKHPIILPPKSNLTKLIIENEHERLLHAGPQLLHSQLREKYWIVNAKSIIRSITHKCLKCFRLKAKQSQQLMGQLPKHRSEITYKAFMNCGVDYAGPLTIRHGGRRSRVTTKCYIALFICLCTKAIHLELVSDLTTDAFIGALRRFMSRRGLPSNIYSDNGKNFIGANNLIKALYTFLNNNDVKQKVIDFSSENGIQWHFIPPNSPHFGGLWEAGVKSMKYHLRRTLGNLTLNFEELSTIITQIEACLNSRPLCSLSSDSSDPQPLTPGHFLIGCPVATLPDHDYSKTPISRLNRWQLVQQSVQKIWNRWSSDYLSQLQQRSKWVSSHSSIQPGVLVLIKEDNTPPMKWKLGIIEQIHPGPDNLVRVATVRTSSGSYKRAVTKLCPLPTSD